MKMRPLENGGLKSSHRDTHQNQDLTLFCSGHIIISSSIRLYVIGKTSTVSNILSCKPPKTVNVAVVTCTIELKQRYIIYLY